jgi:hypothetical protein
MSELHGLPGIYRVTIRRDKVRGAVRPEAEALDGREFEFRPGWQIRDERPEYSGELAMIPDWRSTTHPYPEHGPPWIASGDLVFIAEKTYPKPPAPGQLELGDPP